MSGVSRRTPQDDALDYVKSDGSVIFAAEVTKLPIIDVAIKKTSRVSTVKFPATRFNDDMIAQLTKIEDLESVILLGANPGKSDVIGQIPLEELQTGVSENGIEQLQKRFPHLKVYVNPISEFTRAVDSAELTKSSAGPLVER